MNLRTYPTTAHMEAAIRQIEKDSHQGIHPAQSTMTFGDTWMMCDVRSEPMFGRFWTLDEIAADAGPDYYESSCDEAHAALARGELYGCFHSATHPVGQHDYVSKALTWPIDPALFDQLGRVEWNHLRLDEAGFIMLEHAVRGFEGWEAERG